MIDFELAIDGHFVYAQRSDGLIVSTPTGSTAYALSGGGPIMHPRLNAMVMVPLNPHTLTSRPLVVDGDSEIKIRITTEKVNPWSVATAPPASASRSTTSSPSARSPTACG